MPHLSRKPSILVELANTGFKSAATFSAEAATKARLRIHHSSKLRLGTGLSKLRLSATLPRLSCDKKKEKKNCHRVRRRIEIFSCSTTTCTATEALTWRSEYPGVSLVIPNSWQT